MSDTVDITIPVKAEIASALADPRSREEIGRLVSRIVRRRWASEALPEAIAGVKVEARDAGLRDDEIDDELATYNAERRSRGGAD